MLHQMENLIIKLKFLGVPLFVPDSKTKKFIVIKHNTIYVDPPTYVMNTWAGETILFNTEQELIDCLITNANTKN